MNPLSLSRTLAAALAVATLVTACAGGAPRSDALFTRIQPGMTRDEVQRIIGAPDETMKFPLSRSEAWDYRFNDSWGYIAIFSVTFGADGAARSTFTNRVNAGGDHGGR